MGQVYSFIDANGETRLLAEIVPPISGGGAVVQATATLNDAAIRTIHSVGTVVVPGIAGKVLVPISAVFVLNATAGAYTSNAPALAIATDTSNDLYGLGTFTDAATVLADAATNFCVFPGVTADSYDLLSTGYSGQGLMLLQYGGGTDPTGGNAANTLEITVAYYVVTVP